jgi:hypothetical protein
VNGDYWVVDNGDGVVVSTVTPSPTGSGSSFRNGSQVNPSDTDLNGIDGRADSFTEVLAETFPLTLNPNDSLISHQSIESSTGSSDVTGYTIVNDAAAYVQDASVLTCLATIPPADAFRPPYCGTKTIHREADLNTASLGTVSITGQPTTAEIGAVATMFEKSWIDFKTGWTGRPVHPINNMPNYGREFSNAVARAAVLLNLNYTTAEKRDLLIYFTQLGIDLYGIAELGDGWSPDGGHMSGRKVPILIAGELLGNSAMKAASVPFGEIGQTYYGVTASANAGQTNVAYWGQDALDTYYQAGCTGVGAKDARPSTLDDDACPDYRSDLSSGTWVGQCMAIYIMGLKADFNHDAYFDYLDRYMAYGNDPAVVNGASVAVTYAETLWNEHRGNY